MNLFLIYFKKDFDKSYQPVNDEINDFRKNGPSGLDLSVFEFQLEGS